MINKFATLIDKCSLPGEWNHKASLEAAKELLDQLEEAGMNPPTNEARSFKLLDSGEMTYNVTAWDPEDEA